MLKTDVHLNELLGKGAIAFGYRVIGVGLMFVLQIVLARKLGAFEFGLYSMCVALTMLLASLARAGLDLAIIRKVSEALAQRRDGCARGWFSKSTKIVLATGALTSLTLIALADVVATEAYREPRLAAPLRLFALAVPATALMLIVAESLKGLKEIGSAAMVQNVMVPLLLVATVIALPPGSGARVVAILYLAATLISLGYGYRKWTTATRGGDTKFVAMRDVIRFGWPFFLANIGSILLTWSDTIIVGFFSSPEIVAGYFAASKLATMTSFILISINAISAPKFSSMYALGDRSGLEKLARQSTGVMIGLAAVPIVLLTLIPAFWLGLFGSTFEHARFALLALTAGQAVNVGCGSVGLLLAMTGHERAMGRIFLLTALLTICMSFAGGAQWGANGVAASTAIGMVIWNVWMLIAVRRYLGFWTFPRLFGRLGHSA